MDEKELVEQALDALLSSEAVRDYRDALIAAREELAWRASPDDVPSLRSGVAGRLVLLQACGYLDPATHIPPPMAEDTATDYGMPRPTPAEREQLWLSVMPSVAEALDWAVREHPLADADEEIDRQAASEGTPPGGKSATTFIFLADPQASSAQGMNDSNERVQQMSHLNEALNNLVTWPDNKALSCPGMPVGTVDGIFFGGDLCQTGGQYDFWDQVDNLPPTFRGGWELSVTRHLFQPSFNWDGSSVTRTKYQASYFGLGNHDIQTEYHPPVAWWPMGMLEHGPANYWRDQMWNFICQMHTGVWFRQSNGKQAVYPVTSIDADGSGGFDWTKHSFNYKVNLGPVDVYQVHRYGGDSEYGRPSGLDWLRAELQRGGTDRPVIIVQHYSFADWGPFTPTWTQDQRDAFLMVLEPYNVVALLTGHLHDPQGFALHVRCPGVKKTFREFRPGSAGAEGNFALIRVTASTIDVQFGNGTKGSVIWQEGEGFAVDPFEDWDEIPGNKLFTSSPAVYTEGSGVTHVYAVGQDRQLYYSKWDRQWTPWEPLGGPMTGTPAIVSEKPGWHDVFVVGGDAAMKHLTWDGKNWVGPVSMGGALHPGPVAVSVATGQIDVVAHGLDGRLWHCAFKNNLWSDLAPRPDVILSSPAAIAWAGSIVQIVALGPRSDVLHNWHDTATGKWNGWESMGGTMSSPPVLAAPNWDRLEIFARGTDMSLQHRYWTKENAWNDGFSAMGGARLSSQPSAATPAPNRIEVLASQLDHTVGRVFWDNGWGTMVGKGGLCTVPPVAARYPGAQLRASAYVLGPDSKIHYKQLP